jgi:hypothetical protein
MSKKICPICKQDVDGVECSHSAYEILCCCFWRLEELEKRLGPKPAPTPPPTELERLQAELKRWEKYYPDNDIVGYNSNLYRIADDGFWRIYCHTLNPDFVDDCRTILDCILVDQLHWAYDHAYHIHRTPSGWYSFPTLPTFHTSMLDALFALRERLEQKKGPTENGTREQV